MELAITNPALEPEFIRCHECGHVWFDLWLWPASAGAWPNCPECHSGETFPVADATPFEAAQLN